MQNLITIVTPVDFSPSSVVTWLRRTALPADGYNLLMYGQNIAYLHMLYPDLGFDPVKDFAPITRIGMPPNIITVHPSTPFKSIKELAAHGVSLADTARTRKAPVKKSPAKTTATASSIWATGSPRRN